MWDTRPSDNSPRLVKRVDGVSVKAPSAVPPTIEAGGNTNALAVNPLSRLSAFGDARWVQGVVGRIE